jgi:hypothetical protein
MTTGDQKLILRSNDPETIKRWLFTFQKSLALVLSAIIEGHEKPWADPSKLSEPLGLGFHPSTVFTSLPSSNFEDLSSIIPINHTDQSGMLASRQSFNRSPSIPHTSLERRRTFGQELRSEPIGNESTINSLGISSGLYRQVSVDNEAVMYRNQQQTATTGRPPVSPSAVMMSSSYHVSSTGYLSTPINLQRPFQPAENTYSHLARSPVIPISPALEREHRHSKVAESYVDADRNKSMLDSAMQLMSTDADRDHHRDSISTIASDMSSDHKHRNDG